MVEHGGSSAQRIRIGLTGLAFAFLLVLLGSVIARSGRDDGARQTVANAEPNEPLAELGVAPGATSNSDSNAVNSSSNR
jgi:hypothetical protein